MNLHALSVSVNTTGERFSFDDISTIARDGSLVVRAVTPKGRKFIRRQFNAVTKTIQIAISPFELATLCEIDGVQADFDPFQSHEDWSGDE